MPWLRDCDAPMGRQRRYDRRVLEGHLDEIADADLDVIVVVNPGCYRQLQQGVKRRKLRTKVLHIAELLAGVR